MQRQPRRWLVVFVGLCLLPYVWYPQGLVVVRESLGAMSGRGVSSGSIYPLLVAMVGQTNVALLFVMAAWGLWLLWWARREPDPARYLFLGIAAAACLAPTLHPWYLLWLIPLFCFWRAPALITLSATAIFSYAVWPRYLIDGSWVFPMWSRLLEYAPVVICAIWSLRSCVWRSSFLLATKPTPLVRS